MCGSRYDAKPINQPSRGRHDRRAAGGDLTDESDGTVIDLIRGPDHIGLDDPSSARRSSSTSIASRSGVRSADSGLLSGGRPIARNRARK
jgi:hypothetical protein